MEPSNLDLANSLQERIKELDLILHRRAWRDMGLRMKPGQMFLMAKLMRASSRDPSGLRVSDLAAAFDVTASGMTQMVTGLEERGYVRRTMDPDDRRAVRVLLTDEGRKLMKSAMDSLNDFFLRLVDHLGREKSGELIGLLREMGEFLTSTGGAAPGDDQDGCLR